MKKQIILLAMWALTSAAAFASQEGFTVKIEKGDASKTLVVRIANLDKLDTEIGIQSTEGRVWYSDYLYWKSDFATKINLSVVPDGDYVLYVRNYAEMWVQTLSVNGSGLDFFETPHSEKRIGPGIASLISYHPGRESTPIARFSKDGLQKVGLLLLNLEMQPARINIVEIGSDRVYSQSVNGQRGISTVLNMTGLMPDGYFIYIHTADATFVQFFKLTEEDLSLGDYHSSGNSAPAMKNAISSN